MPWELISGLVLAVLAIGTGYYLLRHAPGVYVRHRAEMSRPSPAGECQRDYCRKPAQSGSAYCSTQHDIDADWINNA